MTGEPVAAPKRRLVVRVRLFLVNLVDRLFNFLMRQT